MLYEVITTPDKKKLYNIHNFDFPEIQKEILELEKHWDQNEKNMIDTLFLSIKDTLFESHKFISYNFV